METDEIVYNKRIIFKNGFLSLAYFPSKKSPKNRKIIRKESKKKIGKKSEKYSKKKNRKKVKKVRKKNQGKN